MLDKIQDASFVALKVTNDTVALGNALYSYLLTKQKKVTLFSDEMIEKRFDFLPWYEKVRVNKPVSADLEYDVVLRSVEVFEFLDRELKQFNEKIATSLYASFLVEQNKNVFALADGTKLAVMAQLIQRGADAKKCVHNICRRDSLALFRLRSFIFGAFVIEQSANVVHIDLTKEMLEGSGAGIEDVHRVAYELLALVHIQRVEVVFEEKTILVLEENE